MVAAVLLPVLQLVGGDGVVVVGSGQAVLRAPVLLGVLPLPAGAPHLHRPALRLDDPGVGVHVGED